MWQQTDPEGYLTAAALPNLTPRRRLSLRGIQVKALADRIKLPGSLRRLAEMPLFVAGLGCVSAAAFEGCLIAGLVVTGLSLIGLEYLIADEH